MLPEDRVEDRSNVILQVDFSKQLIGWVKEQKYALLDVNVYPKAFQTSTVSTVSYSTARYLTPHLDEEQRRQGRLL